MSEELDKGTESWRAILNSPSGRRVLHDILEWTGFFHSLPRGENLQSAVGAHGVGSMIFHTIKNIDTEHLAVILKESKEGFYD